MTDEPLSAPIEGAFIGDIKGTLSKKHKRIIIGVRLDLRTVQVIKFFLYIPFAVGAFWVMYKTNPFQTEIVERAIGRRLFMLWGWLTIISAAVYSAGLCFRQIILDRKTRLNRYVFQATADVGMLLVSLCYLNSLIEIGYWTTNVYAIFVNIAISSVISIFVLSDIRRITKLFSEEMS